MHRPSRCSGRWKGEGYLLERAVNLEITFACEETLQTLMPANTLIGYIYKSLMVDRFAEVYPPDFTQLAAPVGLQ